MTDLAATLSTASLNGSSAPAPAAAAAPAPGTQPQPLAYGFAVVIPAKDEARAVRGAVDQMRETMVRVGQPFEIIVVDDGSSDATAEEARAAGAEVIQHPQNMGYGAALKTGIARAQFDHIVIADADGTYPIDRIPDLIAEADRFDMVVGARQGKFYRESWLKELYRFFLSAICTWVTGTRVPDANSGLRVFRTNLATQYFHLISQGFSFTTTITLAALSNGYFVKYIPIDYHERIGRSKVRLRRDIPRTTQILLQAIVYYNPIKCFLAFALGCLALALISWIVFAVTRSAVAGISGVVWSFSVVQFIGLGLLADLIRVRHVPRAPILTSHTRPPAQN